MSEFKVIVGQRIEGLSSVFYSSQAGSLDKGIIDDVSSHVLQNASLEMKGEIACDSILKVAKVCNCEEYIMEDGRDIPVVPDVIVYKEAFMEYNREELKAKEITQNKVEMRAHMEKRIRNLNEELNKHNAKEHLYPEVDYDSESDSDSENESTTTEGNNSNSISAVAPTPNVDNEGDLEVGNSFNDTTIPISDGGSTGSERRRQKAALKKQARKRQKWIDQGKRIDNELLTAHLSLSNENNQIAKLAEEKAKIIKESNAAATKQWNDDVAAVQRLQFALNLVFKHMSETLAQKIPSIIPILQRINGSCNPYKTGDPKGCYRNMTKEYKKQTDMGISEVFHRISNNIYNVKFASQKIREGEKGVSLLYDCNKKLWTTEEVIGTLVYNFISPHDRKELSNFRRTCFYEEDGITGSDGFVHKTGDQLPQYETMIKYAEDIEASLSTNRKLSHGSNNGNKNDKDNKKSNGKDNMVFNTTNEGKNNGQPVVCWEMKNKGFCKFGDKCHYLEGHNITTTGKASDSNKGSNTTNATSSTTGSTTVKPFNGAGGGTANKNVHSMYNIEFKKVEDQYNQMLADYENEFEINVLNEANNDVSENEEVTPIMNIESSNNNVGWDTMAGIHAAGSIDILSNVQKCNGRAVGVGGVALISAEGTCAKLNNIQMKVIDGNTQSIMSIGRVLQPDNNGNPGVAIFTDKGAIRFRATAETNLLLNKLYKHLEDNNAIEGTAQLKNHVYQQDLDTKPIELYKVTMNLFANRLHFDNAESTIDYLVSAGLEESAFNLIKGLPKSITPEIVKRYFKYAGKPVERVLAEITHARMDTSGSTGEKRIVLPGEEVQADNLDPSYGRLRTNVSEEENMIPKFLKKIVPSIGGYKDAVVMVDVASLFVYIIGRTTKKDPHKIIEQIILQWNARFGKGVLKVIHIDKEFFTMEGLNVALQNNVQLRLSVPKDHKRYTGQVEGVIRRIQDGAQGNMNNLDELVEHKVLTSMQAKTLWFHATLNSVVTFNLKPAKCNPNLSRYAIANNGVEAILGEIVLMPFGQPLVARSELSNYGRGVKVIYVGAYTPLRGGCVVYDPKSSRTSLKYSVQPISNIQRNSRTTNEKIAKDMYGKLTVTAALEQQALRDAAAQAVAAEGGRENDNEPRIVEIDEDGNEILQDNDEKINNNDEGYFNNKENNELVNKEIFSPETIDNEEIIAVELPKDNVDTTSNEIVKPRYEFRERKKRVFMTELSDENVENDEFNVFAILDEEISDEADEKEDNIDRPPKPSIDSRKVCEKDPEWKEADLREAQKFIDMEVLKELPMDSNGRPIIPPNAKVLRLIRIREIKWKKNPKTGKMGWMKCSRFVCDGSQDKSNEQSYAVCPDRMLFFLMMSIGATIGEYSETSDVMRAYLNAESIDRNIVIYVPPDIPGLPRYSLMHKGLYGSRTGALSWQVCREAVFKSIGFKESNVARGTNIRVSNIEKKPNSDENDTDNYEQSITRLLCHTDDVVVSSLNNDEMKSAENDIMKEFKMEKFRPVDRFTGCTVLRINAITGLPDLRGNIVLVHQKEKISEMMIVHKKWHDKFNPNNKTRSIPVPKDAIKMDDELVGDNDGIELGPEDKRDFQSLNGMIGWIAGSTRGDVKFGHYLCSTRSAKPRMYDMRLAVHIMDYLFDTIETPLVLGGDIVDPIVYSDASHATLPERRSVIGHYVCTGPGSGAIYTSVTHIKSAVVSSCEAEIHAASQAVDTAVYTTLVCNELLYNVPKSRAVKVDNEAAIAWIKGSVSNKGTRHVDIRLYHSRHLQEAGDVRIEYVSTEDNIADILTKPLDVKKFRKFARMLLGHELIKGLNIKGYLNDD